MSVRGSICAMVIAVAIFAWQSVLASVVDMSAINLQADTTEQRVSGNLRPGSHVKLFIPNLPYLAISHAVNGALLRPANNDRGWQYDLATSHYSPDDKIWDFQLRRDAYFQDGSHFNADSVIENMRYFKKAPFTFSNLHNIFESVEKLGEYRVRFILSKPYGVFPHDAIWLQFYTKAYLEKFGWNGKPTCPNLAEPGPYALGPYVLTEGYVEGDRSSPKVVLKANSNYWGEEKPKVETITIFTDLTLAEARNRTLYEEGEVDLTPVAFADQVQAVLAPYSKLAVSPSMNNYAMHFNMLNGNSALLDKRIRFVINRAIDQEYLLNLSMLGEGMLSPTMVSPNFYRVDEALEELKGYFDKTDVDTDRDTRLLAQMVKGYQASKGLDLEQPLKLTLLAQESFLFLIRDIQFFLKQVNIELDVQVVDSEKQVFKELLSTWKDKNEISWDLLLWGNYDWYKHPWAAFFVYRPEIAWSTIPASEKLFDLTDRLLRTGVDSDEYVSFISEFIQHVYENDYMVFLPTPHNVYAVNKEVLFSPGRSAFVYLRDLEVTDLHWSVRDMTEYPESSQQPFAIKRMELAGDAL